MPRSRTGEQESGYVKVKAIFDVVNYHDGDAILSHEKASMGDTIELPVEELKRLEDLGAVEKMPQGKAKGKAKKEEEAVAEAHEKALEEAPTGGQDPAAVAPGGASSEEALAEGDLPETAAGESGDDGEKAPADEPEPEPEPES